VLGAEDRTQNIAAVCLYKGWEAMETKAAYLRDMNWATWKGPIEKQRNYEGIGRPVEQTTSVTVTAGVKAESVSKLQKTYS
jgi:hypothetical protein